MADEGNKELFCQKSRNTIDRITPLIADAIAPLFLSADDLSIYENLGSSDTETKPSAEEINSMLVSIIATIDPKEVPAKVLEAEVPENLIYTLEQTISISMKYLRSYLSFKI